MKFTDLGNGLIDIEVPLKKGDTIYSESLLKINKIETLLSQKRN